MIIKNLKDYIEKYISEFFTKTQEIKDTARKRPQVKASTIFVTLFYSLACGIKSLLSLDKFLKRNAPVSIKNDVNVMKFSDSIVQKVLPKILIETLRNVHKYVISRLLEIGNFENSLLRMGVCVVDASQFLKRFYASVFYICGKNPMLLDWEIYEKKGKELPSSKRLIKRVLEEFSHHLDVILFDGLYYCEGIMELCVKYGLNFVIKTKEEGLDIMKDALKLLERANDINFKGDINRKEGEDFSRGIKKYKIIGCCGFSYQGIKQLCVYKVEIERIRYKNGRKKIEKEESFLITQIRDIDIVLELMFKRWSVENDLFKQLKTRCNLGKSVYVRNKEGFERFFYIVAIMFNVVEAYIEYEKETSNESKDKFTKSGFIEKLKEWFTIFLLLLKNNIDELLRAIGCKNEDIIEYKKNIMLGYV